jgi:hypothetical protein
MLQVPSPSVNNPWGMEREEKMQEVNYKSLRQGIVKLYLHELGQHLLSYDHYSHS